MKFIFVKSNSNHYNQGIEVRKKVFFKGFENAYQLLNDSYELNSIHLIAIENNNVFGTGRLTFINKTEAIISQMATLPNFQNKGIGKRILKMLMENSFQNNCKTIKLSARISALEFYKKEGFKPFGKVYPSKKTGVLHQEMILVKL